MRRSHKAKDINKKPGLLKKKSEVHTFIIFGVISLLAINSALAVVVLRRKYSSEQASSAKILDTGTSAQQAGVSIRLGKTTFEPGSVPSFMPEEGNTFLVQEVTVTNNTDKTIAFYPSIQTYIRDVEGQIFTMRPTMTLQDPFEAGDIPAHQTKAGTLSFEVSKRMKGLKMYFDSGWGNRGPVVFDLKL